MKLKNLILQLAIGVVFSIITTMSFATTLKSGIFTGSNIVKETLKHSMTLCTSCQQCMSVPQCRANANQEVDKYGGGHVYQCLAGYHGSFCYAGSTNSPGGSTPGLLPSRLYC